MTQEDIIKLAREAGLAYGSDEKPLGSVTRFAALVAAAERNKLAQWMIDSGYSTGHGDTTEDLLEELDWQITESWSKVVVASVEAEREACAKVCDNEATIEGIAQRCAAAIRARGNT